ncbi:MAG: hypothetical protein MJ065_08235 [Oscillospiraceae bacterium]|nr:hypothetical protein [Oscillospiraceae bacterium]
MEMTMTLKLYSMPAVAAKLGYCLPFMNRICQRAYCSGRPFLVLKDENGKYYIEANSLQRYIDTCPDFNPYEIPGVYEPDSNDEDTPMDDSVFMLNDDLLPQVCGVLVDDECAPLISYNRHEPQLLVLTVVEADETEKLFYQSEND